MKEEADPARVSAKRRLPRWLLVFYGLLIVIFVAVGAGLGTLVGYQYSLPRIESLEDYRPDVITDIFSADNKVIGDFAVERRIVVTFEEIPPYLQMAILAAEDDQFYNHSGVNYYRLIRAASKDIVLLLRMKRPEGASTITQQLARMLLHSNEPTLDRKIKELLTTWKIEKQYAKRQILTLYCNLHPMGHGAYGVAAAADTYFGKQLKDLTLDECAMIAGLPRNPGMYSPRLHPAAALSRRNFILERMVTERMITPKLAAEAKARPIVLKPRTRNNELAPYFVEWVRQSLADRYTTDVIWRKGLRVYTTLDIPMQEAANKALREGLRAYDKKRGWRGPVDNILKNASDSLESYTNPEWRLNPRPGDISIGLVQSVGDKDVAIRIGKYRATIGPKAVAWTRAKSPAQILKAGDLAYFQIVSVDDSKKAAEVLLEQVPDVQAAMIVLQNSTGEIRAMVGGYDFESSEFNRATQAMRQAGSTFKPIVYTTALEKGMDTESEIIDAPITFTDALGRSWNPVNYDGKFKGRITLRQALTESRNVPTIKIASLLGIKNVVITARRFGLAGPLEPYLPLAIGACEATPLEMATAFTVFPNLGIQPRPYFIRRIEDYDHAKKEETLPQAHRVLDTEIADKMLGLLENVVQNGTATAAKSLGRPLGGKTGTTNDFTDAWFVGFTPSITTAVWVGFDGRKSLGDKESGAVVALPIWIRFMEQVLKDKPVENFAKPEAARLELTEGTEPGTASKRKIFVEDLPGTTPTKKP
jgi:penicillin-binding protein 1A